jgi:hypothetical protein
MSYPSSRSGARQPRKVTDPVRVAVEERADVRLVDDGVLVPEGVEVGCHARNREMKNFE